MRYISEHHEVISIPDAVERLCAGRLSSRTVTVTFDDGYEDNLTVALPILRKYKVPATIYITTAGPDRQRYLWWYELESIMDRLDSGTLRIEGLAFQWSSLLEKHNCYLELNEILKRSTPEAQEALLCQARDLVDGCAPDFSVPMLTWDQVRQLDADPLITIGCHTCNHFPMTQLSKDQLDEDLRASKAVLEAQLGHAIEHFAYPYGRRPEASRREFAAVESAGFRSAVTTRFAHWMPSHSQHLHELPRVAINHEDTLRSFRTKVTGVRSLILNRGWPLITD